MAATPMLPPGPRMPRGLQALGFSVRPGPFLEGARARYGDTFTLRVEPNVDWVLVSRPEDVRTVFTASPDVLLAGRGNQILLPVLGRESVLLADRAQHLRQRKLLLPPFHGERLKRFEAEMAAVAEQEIARWPAGATLKLHPHMQALTLEVIMRVVFGVRDTARLDRLRAAIVKALEGATSKPTMLAMMALGPHRVETLKLMRPILGPADRLLMEEVERARRAPDLEERDDVLAMLVRARHEDGAPMTDAQLRDELVTLLVAGHETTATALSWALERLLRVPHAWQRLRAAEDDAYAEAVAKETLRLRPVLSIVVRELAAPFEVAGRELPAGACVVPCIWLLHRRPDLYPDPLAFKPERFLEGPQPGTYEWIPFGGGVRRCIGAAFALQEMRVVLQAVARSASLCAPDPAPERVTRRFITLAPARGALATRDGAGSAASPAPAAR
jgi:cytochrome P450